MKFFLDTARLEEIEKAIPWGIVDGVTTNPSLMAKEGVKDFDAHYQKIAFLVKGPVSAEVTATDVEGMLQQARHLKSLAPNIVVKIPFTYEGVQVLQQLRSEGIPTNCTLIFSAAQALIAAKAGATYVSPFIGRLDDISHEGVEIIQQIREIFDNYNFSTKILAASIRHPMHVVTCAQIGADIATMPFKVLEQLFLHPLTEKGLAQFLKDYEQARV